MTTIESIRAELVATLAEHSAVQAQVRSRADTGSAIAEHVAGLGAQFHHRVDRALRQIAAGHSVELSVGRVFGDTGIAPFGERALDAVGLVGLLGVDAVAGVLLARLEAVVPVGLDAAARVARLAELADRSTQLQFEEEAAIIAAETAGVPVARRDDCDIAIVLAATAPTRPAARPRAAMPAEVAEEISAEQADRQMRRARERLQAAPGKSEYLARGRNKE